MLVRTLAAAVLLPVFILIIYFAPLWTAAAALCLLCILAAHEFVCATGLVKSRAAAGIAMVAAAGIPWWMYFKLDAAWLLLGLFLLVTVLFTMAILRHDKVRAPEIFAALFGGAVLPFFLSLMLTVLMGEKGKYLVLMPFIAAWMSDTCAYFGGTFFGKHKLAPEISPKKTVEGSAIGIVGACLFQLLYAWILMRFFEIRLNIPVVILFGLAGAAVGQIGDLALSLVKREVGIKDYGKLMPGHGGVLDRFDSVIFILPLFCALDSIFGMIL